MPAGLQARPLCRTCLPPVQLSSRPEDIHALSTSAAKRDFWPNWASIHYTTQKMGQKERKAAEKRKRHAKQEGKKRPHKKPSRVLMAPRKRATSRSQSPAGRSHQRSQSPGPSYVHTKRVYQYSHESPLRQAHGIERRERDRERNSDWHRRQHHDFRSRERFSREDDNLQPRERHRRGDLSRRERDYQEDYEARQRERYRKRPRREEDEDEERPSSSRWKRGRGEDRESAARKEIFHSDSRGNWKKAKRAPEQAFLDVEAPPRKLDHKLKNNLPILLFDLNGTLTSHTHVRKSSGRNLMRPGLHHLRRLLAHFNLGIFTSASVRTVTDAKVLVEEAAGKGPPLFQHPFLVLHRSHTIAAPLDHRMNGGNAWDTSKPLGRYFSNLGRVLLVDDDAYKACEGEAANMVLMPRWEEEPEDECVKQFVDATLAATDGMDEDTDLRMYSKAISASLSKAAPSLPAAAEPASMSEGSHMSEAAEEEIPLLEAAPPEVQAESIASEEDSGGSLSSETAEEIASLSKALLPSAQEDEAALLDVLSASPVLEKAAN